jgi:sugar phosphate isomerase/epimerase
MPHSRPPDKIFDTPRFYRRKPKRNRMKIASSSTSFDKSLSQGDLTQLEWLHLCASPLALDGVVFNARHFPRTDDEYLAQLKKTATDVGLTVAAVAADALLEPEGLRWLEIAALLGAPVVIARTPRAADTSAAWNELAATARASASIAKRANVTIALRNAPETMCASAADLKRLAKEVDSSWLRYALDIAELPSLESAGELLARAVVACHDADSADDNRISGLLSDLCAFRAFLVVDAPNDRVTIHELARLIERIKYSETSFADVKA